MKKLLFSLVSVGVIALGALTLSAQSEPKEKGKKKEAAVAQSSETAPKSVIHVVTVRWKKEATEEQIKAALDGVKAMPAKYKGMTRVWTKTMKVQNQRGVADDLKITHAFVMEFADEAAFKAYTDSPAQLEWYNVYTPIREVSTTHDITN
jgi:hypothetical protein